MSSAHHEEKRMGVGEGKQRTEGGGGERCHGYRDGGRKGGLREVGDGMSDELTCA